MENITKGVIMKRFILFSILSVLLCSAPGHAAKHPADTSAEMAAVLGGAPAVKALTPEERAAAERAVVIKACDAGYAAFLAKTAEEEAEKAEEAATTEPERKAAARRAATEARKKSTEATEAARTEWKKAAEAVVIKKACDAEYAAFLAKEEAEKAEEVATTELERKAASEARRASAEAATTEWKKAGEEAIKRRAAVRAAAERLEQAGAQVKQAEKEAEAPSSSGIR